jgi:hypothetical protein
VDFRPLAHDAITNRLPGEEGKWRAPKEPAGSGIETTTPDCCGLFGAGDQLAHTVRNRALPDKEQFGERFVIAISRDVSHNFPLLQFLLIKWAIAIALSVYGLGSLRPVVQ